MDGLRSHLEKISGRSLTDSSRMRSYIPLIADVETGRIKDSLKDAKEVTVIFDGSTRVDRILAVIFRYTTKEFNIVQDLAHLGKYEKLKNPEQVIKQYSFTCNKKINPTC